ncbi:MAG: ComEC/Rec2 family competence protein [Chitinophagaceae bacterium]|nr:ComEC/Rec2 family competence protein [Chitinophagaceae bacterium]
MTLWNKAPFLRFIFPFLIGILSYYFFSEEMILFHIAVFCIAILSVLLFSKMPISKQNQFFYLKGIAIQLLFYCFAYFICFLQSNKINKKHYQHQYKNYTHAKIKLNENPIEKEKTVKANVDILILYNNKLNEKTEGKLLVYFTKNEKSLALKKNDEIVIPINFNEISNRGNPGEFDYKKFCANKNIFHQQFLKENEWKQTGHTSKFFISSFDNFSETILKIIEKYIPEKENYAIAKALLIGYRDEIDSDTYQAFANTGLVHLIAISGMHLGIFYLGVLKIILQLNYFKKRRKLATILALIFMWSFALLTSLPASILRSGIMFSALAIAQFIERKVSSINVLSFTAFILLIIKPLWLFDVGFQLSFLAVLGILIFYKPIYNTLKHSNNIIDFFIQITSVSLAAQIFTFPISIYYFHQMPLLFLITNLIAIPLVSLLLYGLIVLILFSPIPFLASIIGKILSILLQLLIKIIAFFNSFSFVSWQQIHCTAFQTILLYVIVIFLAFFIFYKNKNAFILSICCAIAFVLIAISFKINTLKTNQFIVLNSSFSPIIIQKGNKANLFCDSNLISDKKFNTYALTPCETHFGFSTTTKPLFSTKQNDFFDIIEINNILLLRIKNWKALSQSTLKADYVIFSEKYLPEATWINEHIGTKQLIIDNNTPLWKIDKTKNDFSSLNLPIHFTAEDRAFVKKF